VGGGLYGVAKNTRLKAVRVLDCAGSGTVAGVVGGVDFVTANRNGPSVASMSLGGSPSQALDDAITRAASYPPSLSLLSILCLSS
jgi:subtilisin family serine protease